MILVERDELETIKTGDLIYMDPARSMVVVLEQGSSSQVKGIHLKRPVPSGLPLLEAVIAGKADIDDVNRSEMSGRVDSFFMREEFLWTARSISSLSPSEALEREGPSMVAASTERAMNQLLAALKPEQRLTFRLLDLRSDEAVALATTTQMSSQEPNPELGLHGARWILHDMGYQECVRRIASRLDWRRVTIAIPFINDELELDSIFDKLRVGNADGWGVFVETPAAVDRLPHMLDRGISVVNVGTKDLVQFILAADRNNRSVAHIYNTRHPSVMQALTTIASHCSGYNVVLRIFTLGADLDYYYSSLPDDTRFMMCTKELLELSPDGEPF
jgi:pyruvate, water dikinase